MQSAQIKELLTAGESIEDIATGLDISPLEVKALVRNQSVDISLDEELECKEVLLAYARGQVSNQSQDHQLTAAKYIHRSAREDRSNNNAGKYTRTIEVLGALKAKGSERSKQYEEPIPV